ncbi:Glutaminyl-tRNA synthetase [Neophaeococcomyces mojaviensis]|uniref:Glutaminyl-tRNA synthetase n=1 Tax=Neophaeococcomyces mojaviensis TaxID=3383035 RepID=A0ACC3A630_9EURO|nr:Glutaminyl-tRNA synthetase [Knufia sp. JES_112]
MAEPSNEGSSMVDKVKEKVEDALPTRSKKQEKKDKKAAEKAVKKEQYAKEGSAAPKKAPKAVSIEPTVVRDPDAMFKEGWLDEVRKERPAKDVYTRFPPEPNGYLHIGHSKAIAVNFGFARYHGGKCYLRFDDTNPEAEEEKFFSAIEDIIAWLGFKPYKITYSSDNFDRLYDLAEKLILRDGAYICECNDEQIKDQRGGTDEKNKHPRYACKHRDRPVDESLAEFRAMRDGKYKPKEAFLRMKQDDFKTGNPQMWDLAAYRIIDEPAHHRTGKKWRIYPTYDFTHCLCDSFEGITHSLCTVEFINSRESYEWLCDAVEVYKPMQREYGRLNLTGTIMSKRKIARLVKEGKVFDWDDPRLYTLVALRRRGVPPGAILSFVNELGVTTARSNIQTVRFESSVRKYLEMTVPRLMVVIDPIKVIIDNLPEDYVEEVENTFGPKNVEMGSHMLPFTRTVYIERDDFRETASKDFFRLAPGASVGLLKVTYPITCTSFKKDDATGLVTEIRATLDTPAEGETFKKPKSYIHWVAESPKHNSPVKVDARVFNPLFKSENPETVEPDFMADIREDSLVTYSNALAEVGLTEIQRRAPWPEEAGEANDGAEGAHGEVKKPGPESVRFQAMRVGYFCMDKETTADKIILNRIVGLKEDSGKAA